MQQCAPAFHLSHRPPPLGPQLCEQLLEWMQGLIPVASTGLEAHRLCQTLTLMEREEAMAPAVDVREMWTASRRHDPGVFRRRRRDTIPVFTLECARQVPHETALYALHKSRKEAVSRMLRRDARAADRPPARAAQRNVAFLRCVPVGDAAYCKVPDVLRLTVEQPPEL